MDDMKKKMEKLMEVKKYLDMASEKLAYCLEEKSEGPVGSMDELKERAKEMADKEGSEY